MKKLLPILLLPAFAVSAHAALLVEMNFNDSNGNQSLVNRGTLNFTAQYVRQITATTTVFNYGTLGAVPSVNNGLGYAAVGSTGQTRGKIYLGNNITTPSRITQLDNLAALTLTGWINPSASNTGNVSLFDNSNGNAGWRLEYNTTSNIFSVRDGSTSRNFTASAWTTGSWQFFALVFDGSLPSATRFSLYSGDGVTLSSAINAAGNTALGANDGNLTTIAGSTQTFTNEYFIGSLDNFRAYNTNETANLAAIMKTADAIPEPSTSAMILGGVGMLALMRRRQTR